LQYRPFLLMGVVEDLVFNTGSLLIIGTMLPLKNYHNMVLYACIMFLVLSLLQLIFNKLFSSSYWPKKLHLVFLFAALGNLALSIISLSLAERYVMFILHGSLFSFVIVGLLIKQPFTLEFSLSIIPIHEIREIPFLFRKCEIIAAFWAAGYFIMLCADVVVLLADVFDWGFPTEIIIAVYDGSVIVGCMIALWGNEISTQPIRSLKPDSNVSENRERNLESFIESPVPAFGQYASMTATDDEDRNDRMKRAPSGANCKSESFSRKLLLGSDIGIPPNQFRAE